VEDGVCNGRRHADQRDFAEIFDAEPVHVRVFLLDVKGLHKGHRGSPFRRSFTEAHIDLAASKGGEVRCRRWARRIAIRPRNG
jgi:hypothetical protein